MRFRHNRNGIVLFTVEAVAALRAHRQLSPESMEAGGLLLGRYLRGGYDIVVDSITEPLPTDRSVEHNQLIERAWTESGGTTNSVGCWHTHPEPYPTPSEVDTSDWLRMLAEDTLADEACFFVIVGTERVRVWVGDQRTRTISICPEVL